MILSRLLKRLSMAKGRVLIIAGSDSSGGAGIQADIKTVTMLGGYAATAITALTAQNTLGVFGVMDVPADFVTSQIELVLSDIGADAIKTGMLNNVAVVEAVADCLAAYAHIPLVVDPVMVSTSGSKLLQDDALEVLIKSLIPQANLVTPNIPEAEMLAGVKVISKDDMIRAASIILEMGAGAVLLKGGHGESDVISDVLMDSAGDVQVFESKRIDSKHTHGTGCTLASAIACGVAKGMSLRDSVEVARLYVQEAIKSAPGYGEGGGVLGHGLVG